MSDLRYQFEVFEGPLDLLLHLVRKDEVDIYEVDMVQLADQFCEYIDLMKRFDLELAGEFIVMASTLMYIKSKELLPVDLQVISEEDEEEDPRWDLIRQLVEYKKFKDAADDFRRMAWEREQSFERQGAKPKVPPLPPQAAKEASIFDLIGAVNQVLKRFDETEKQRAAKTGEIVADQWSVTEKIELILGILEERESIRFIELFESAGSRLEVITTFLAVLELAKLRQLIAVQGERFGEIELAKRPPEEESESGEPESVGFTAGHSDVEVMGEGKPIAARRASLEVAVDPSEALTMEVGELAHRANEPLTFAPPDETEEEPYDDPNLRELPLATDTGVGRTNRLAKRNRPKPWTADLNLDFPTKDRVIASAILLVVTVLLCWVVF
ncbi:MAG: segregation/condensation protein A [Verrucomicrobia bacterium]|jgi:segregation and condensation protein A|nr:segregation/condensation protein A [Verrucomicrobiota bacterium]MDC0308971.1 segregation/condensation protein A [bacterium]MBT5619867.1 segregation/condensation protein A [Verrucomicrobiota bacterium]MBT6104351.1 segregation/condensation protein A [Verrucomicrobiota bacterium]MBT7735534.1 segregation/condensation protein A [Verrucomicrobiota bacterium]